MTVAELITYLQTLDQSLSVMAYDEDKGLLDILHGEVTVTHIDTIRQSLYRIRVIRTDDIDKPKAVVIW
jgi:hypothetical protein